MKSLSEHILDIIQNSIRANATLIEIIFEEDKKNDLCTLKIIDNGCGMDEEMLSQATNPFFTSRETRKVGLGLSLLKQNAERANGRFELTSELNQGTTVYASFQLSNFDKPPLGDIWNTYYYSLVGNEKIHLNYRHKTDNGLFEACSEELKAMLGNVSLKEREIREAFIEWIKNNLKEIEI